MSKVQNIFPEGAKNLPPPSRPYGVVWKELGSVDV